MNRILALQELSTRFVTDVMAASNKSHECSSESTGGCSSQSIGCPKDDTGFASLEW